MLRFKLDCFELLLLLKFFELDITQEIGFLYNYKKVLNISFFYVFTKSKINENL